MPALINLQSVTQYVANRQEFRQNSACAKSYCADFGLLNPASLSSDAIADLKASTYVVYSYGTPVAWEMPNGGLYVHDATYSQTTSRLQTLLRAAA